MGARKPRPLFYATPIKQWPLFSNLKSKVNFIFLSNILFTWRYLITHHLKLLTHREIPVFQGVRSYQSKSTRVLILLLFSCSFYCLSHCFLISCVYNHPKISLFFKAAPTFNLSMYNLSNFGDPLRIISPSQAPPPPSEKLKYIRFINQGVVSSQLM